MRLPTRRALRISCVTPPWLCAAGRAPGQSACRCCRPQSGPVRWWVHHTARFPVVNHCARQAHPLAHAPGQFGRFLVLDAGRSTTSSASATRQAISFSDRRPVAPEGERHIFGTVIESNRARPGTTSRSGGAREPRPLVHGRDVLPGDQHLAGIRLQQTDQMLQQNALAAAAAPNDDHGFALFNDKGNAVQDRSLAEALLSWRTSIIAG